MTLFTEYSSLKEGEEKGDGKGGFIMSVRVIYRVLRGYPKVIFYFLNFSKFWIVIIFFSNYHFSKLFYFRVLLME